MLSTTCSNIALSDSIPSGEPNFILSDFTVVPFSRRGTRSFTTLGELIPIVTEVGVCALEKPKSCRKGRCAFLAFQSQNAVSKAT